MGKRLIYSSSSTVLYSIKGLNDEVIQKAARETDSDILIVDWQWRNVQLNSALS